MRRVLTIFLDCAYLVVALFYLPVVVYRLIVAGRYRHGWAARLGWVPKRYSSRPCIWLHAVSVGEVNAIRTLVDRLIQQLPFYEVMVSTTTDTGYNRATRLFGPDRVFFFPLDFSCSMTLAFRRLNPALVILVELEVWPNLTLAAKKRSVPIVVVNGRLTERSLRRYRLAKPLTRWMFSQLDRVLVQDETYRRRFIELGVPAEKILATGSLKWDTAEIDESSLQELIRTVARAVGIDQDKSLLVAGSTADTIEEEAIIRAYQQLRVHRPHLQLVIAPRKPERFDQVAKLIKSRGFDVIRRSEHLDGTTLPREASLTRSRVVLLDTLGELRQLYALATVVIVGRTFVPFGGSDVMEIAALGKAMVLGPYTANFADAVDKLLAHDAAIQVESSEKLASTIEGLLSDPSALERIASRAREVVKAERGATLRTVRQICELLGYEYDETHRGIATPQLREGPIR